MKFKETCMKDTRIEMLLAFVSQIYDSNKWRFLICAVTICDRESFKITSLISYLSDFKSEVICKTDVLKNRTIFIHKKLFPCAVALFRSAVLFDGKIGVIAFKFALQKALQVTSVE